MGEETVDYGYLDGQGSLTSFQVTTSEGTIWDGLKKAIMRQVKADGIKESVLQPGETKQAVFEDAVENIYNDVAEFYYWYFVKDDDRRVFTLTQKQSAIPTWLKSAVEPVVKDNLEAMRFSGEIPADRDIPSLEPQVVDYLSRYIVNWQDWYYDRKENEYLDDHYYLIDTYRDIYLETDYGNLTNLSDYDSVEEMEPPYEK